MLDGNSAVKLPSVKIDVLLGLSSVGSALPDDFKQVSDGLGQLSLLIEEIGDVGVVLAELLARLSSDGSLGSGDLDDVSVGG